MGSPWHMGQDAQLSSRSKSYQAVHDSTGLLSSNGVPRRDGHYCKGEETSILNYYPIFMMHTLPDSDYNEVNVTTTEYLLVKASSACKMLCLTIEILTGTSGF